MAISVLAWATIGPPLRPPLAPAGLLFPVLLPAGLLLPGWPPPVPPGEVLAVRLAPTVSGPALPHPAISPAAVTATPARRTPAPC
jgi:hypothetical protein